MKAKICHTLIEAAQNKRLVTYAEVGEPVGLSMMNPNHRTRLGDILCEICREEHEAGNPMLAVIVVHKKDGMPGGRFFKFACELGKYLDGDDEKTFFEAECQRVFSRWGR